MSFARSALVATVPVLVLLAACGEPVSDQAQAPAGTDASAVATAPAALPAPDIATQPLAIPPITASASPVALAIDKAVWSATATTPQAKRDALIRAQVMLSRAHFSPGVIDGQDGGNMKNALMAYEEANAMTVDGVLDQAAWDKLAADTQPAMTDYAITEADVAGPFVPTIPKDYAEMAKLEKLAYATPLEGLAEKFHMDEALLKALNPGADFAVAGTKIVVVAPGPEQLPGAVTRVEVDKTKKQVRAFGADNKLMAAYPATVGSSSLPTPSGEWAVRTIAPNPTWTYDPSRLNFGDKTVGKQTIKAGPNNPVGAVWIDLTKDTYGIHGAPDPRLVGKTASHGCVRLTNWDAIQLSKAVSKQTKVIFTGGNAAPATKA